MSMLFIIFRFLFLLVFVISHCLEDWDCFFFFFSFGCTAQYVGSQFTDQRSNLCLLYWKHKVLTTKSGCQWSPEFASNLTSRLEYNFTFTHLPIVLLFLRQRETFPGMPTQISRTLAQNTSYFATIKVHFIPKTGIKAFSKALLRLMPVLLLETESKKPVPGRVRWPG